MHLLQWSNHVYMFISNVTILTWWSVLYSSVQSLTSPPPPELCSGKPLLYCGHLLHCFGFYSFFLFPTQHNKDVIMYGHLKGMMGDMVGFHTLLENILTSLLVSIPWAMCILCVYMYMYMYTHFSLTLTLFIADTCRWRPSHFLEESSAKALCFSVCVCCMLVVFCSLARSPSSSFILATSLAFSSSYEWRSIWLNM